MGAMTAAIVGMGAISAGTQIMGGFMQKNEAESNALAVSSQASYNAGIYRQQAGMVEQQKQLKAQQDARAIRFAEGKTIAMAANKGLTMSGSPAAVLNDTITQMEMDKAITSYNYDMEKYRLESQARQTEYSGATLSAAYRRGGKDAMIKGLMGGLTTLAGTAFGVAGDMYKPSINTGYGAASFTFSDKPGMMHRRTI